MTGAVVDNVVDVNVLQLLAGAEAHHLRIRRVQPQSAGSHPLIDVMDADSETADGYPYIADNEICQPGSES